MQVARFGLVGSLNTLVDFGVFNLLLVGFQATSAPWLLTCNGVAFLAANFNSYLFNKRWTFQDRRVATSRQYLVFLFFSCGGLAVNSTVVYLVTSVGTGPDGITTLGLANFAKAGAVVMTMAWNFLWYRHLVFSPSRISRPG